MLTAASVLVLSAAPASALAGTASGSHARPPTNQSKQQLPSVPPAGGATVLAFGSGYSSRQDAARVRALQRRLIRLGYAPGPIDGRYGPRTEQAVSALQAARGLQVDGIAGPLTLAAVRKPWDVLYPGAGYVGHGSRRVRGLQRRLTRAGYTPGPIDGRYGPRTEAAVSRFQAAHGLRVDGVAGPQTMGHLGSQPRRAIRPSRPAGPRRRAGRRAHRGRSRPHAGRRQTRGARAPRKVVPVSHSSGAPSLGLVVLLIALAGALGLSAIWLARRRREKPSADVGATVNAASRSDRSDAFIAHSDPSRTTDPGTSPKQGLGGPDEADRAFRHALVLQEQGDLRGAIVAYRHADQLGHAGAAGKLGGLLETQGDRAAAEAWYLRAAQHGDPDGAYNLAALLEEQGDLTEALAAYRRADQLGHGGAASDLGVLLGQRGDLAAAEECFRRAEERGIAAGAFNLGVLLEEQGNHIAAVRAYERAERSEDPALVDKARAAARNLRQTESHAAVREGGGNDGQ